MVAFLEAPPDLQGRPRKDRAMTVLGTLVNQVYLRALNTAPVGSLGSRHLVDTSLRLQLIHREQLTEDVVRLTFSAPDSALLPAWQPGCHLDFHLPSGRRRQYSLCGDPRDRKQFQVAVRLMPAGGGGSQEMHNLEVGAVVTVRGPRNAFLFVPGGSALFIAGGIGITPILPMLRIAQRTGTDWHLLYLGKSRATMPFAAELRRRYPGRVTVRADDEHGVITAEELLSKAEAGGAVYCCGPGPMIEAVRSGFPASPATALHYERFTAPPIVDGKEFTVTLARSGRTVAVPADRSLLEVVKETNPGIGYSCQQGFCGTCKVKVLAGKPDHREKRLTSQEQAHSMLICVSRASADTPLVLDA